MPIKVGIWRLGNKIERVNFTKMPTEDRLEDILAEDISILDPNLFLIGRQVLTSFGKYIDLLAMDADGNIVVIELKRDKTPRDVIAQILEYGSWIRDLENDDIARVFNEYLKKYQSTQAGISLDDAFCRKFGVREMPESLNDTHELMVVASELDDSTERIVNYLSDEYGVSVNAVYFSFFREGNNEYLSRVWLIDPGEVEEKVIEKRGQEPWNGEFYVSFGGSEKRFWPDAMRYGFISAGGGSWYSRTLDLLEIGKRIWVYIPGQGYVGVGKVLDKPKPITEFTLPDASGKQVPIMQIVKNIHDIKVPEDKLEYYVRVEWIKTVPLDKAVNEKGFFRNENSVARPKSKKWAFTVERLRKRWEIQD